VTEPLLAGKLHVPSRRTPVVARARLTERLERASAARLTLVSAPPGFGKSTLLAERAKSLPDRRTAWLSLDAGDNDLRAFWTHVIAALQTTVPGIGVAALALVEPPDHPIHSGITALLNDLVDLRGDVDLVLDDYHVLELPEIHESVGFFLDHLPEPIHLVIATRADPPLSLARMRARGELVEIRAADLRFRAEETAAYLNGVLDLDLAASQVAVLAERTEGWIAALQLAGLSISGREDVGGFIARFAGDNRYIIDYLVEEVLERQASATRSFLLETSVLGRMTAPLCNAVTGQSDGQAMLDRLERGNLFVIALDDRREWYRYHHLFADVLRAQLRAHDPDRVVELHRRASAWHEQADDLPEAIGHAMEAGDFTRSAELVERASPDLTRARQEAQLRGMLEALPVAVLRARPVLTTTYAGALMQTGEFGGVEQLLDHAQATISGSDHPPAVDEAELRRVPATIGMYRTAVALARGDIPGTIENADRGLSVLEPDDHFRRGALSSLRGLAHWTAGELTDAHEWFSAGMDSLSLAGFRADVVGGQVILADIRVAQGRLVDAERHYQHGLDLATAAGDPPLRGAADMHTGLAAIAYERGDLDLVARHLQESQQLGEANGLPKNPWRWRVTAARLRQAEGDLDAAYALLDEAEQVYAGDFAPNICPIDAVRARMWIAAGHVDEAARWATARRSPDAGQPRYVDAFSCATVARVLVGDGMRARDAGTITEAIELADRVQRAATAGGWRAMEMDAVIVEALARWANRDMAGSRDLVSRALEMAAPEGYVRVFLDEGPAMAQLLERAVPPDGAAEQGRRLLAALRRPQAPAGEHRLVEALSRRELDVLRLLATDLSGPDIAAELVVSLNTVRTHTKNIFGKLGVNSRRAAVRRAAELELLLP
jgi:LuxR family transcriptional regulator, maltose regulon positive regulatory protein